MRNTSALATAIKEIVDRLLAGDWWRASNDEGRFYYVIGAAAQGEDQDTGTFTSLVVSDERRPSVLARWYRNAALTSEHPDYVGKAKNVLCGKGVLPAMVEGLVEGIRSGDNVAFSEALSGLRLGDRKTDRQFMNAFCDLLQALHLEETQGELADGGAADERPSEQVAEIREGLEAFYLKDLGERFPKIVDRAARLDPLSFADSRLYEAARCYLYGCFAAAVVFAAAAVEARLRWKTGLTGDNDRTPRLLDEAKARGLLDDAQIEAARTVFARRNGLLHDPSEKEHDVQSAVETLALARDIITALEQA